MRNVAIVVSTLFSVMLPTAIGFADDEYHDVEIPAAAQGGMPLGVTFTLWIPNNVETVRGTSASPELPANTLDLAFIVDAYHEFSHPREMGESLFAALRPGGRLVLVEYRAEDPSVPIKRLHKMSEAQARRELESIGFTWVSTEDYLPQQHVITFQRPESPTKQ